MDTRALLSMFIHCGGDWVENEKSEIQFKRNKQSKTQLIEWERSNEDFNALLMCIYRDFGLQQSKHQLQVSYQSSRFGRELPPVIISTDKALGCFLRDKDVHSTCLCVLVTEIEERELENETVKQQHAIDENEREDQNGKKHDCVFHDEYFDCNLVFDKGSGHGHDGVVLNDEPNANVETFHCIGSHCTLNSPQPNHEVEVKVPKSTQEKVGVEVGHYTRFLDDFDFPVSEVDGEGGPDGTFGDGSGLCVGYEFACKADLKQKMTEVAIAGCFETKTEKSDTTRYILRCRSANCSWMMRAFSVKDSPRFIIKKYNKLHNCAVGELKRNHRQTTSRYVGEIVLATLGGSREHIKPKTIMKLMQNKSMPITYTKAWLGRKFANEKLYGKPCDNYAKLPLYLHVLKEANNGRVYTNLEVDDDAKIHKNNQKQKKTRKKQILISNPKHSLIMEKKFGRP
ncbi:unnamed protein product [Cuscuta campestris]|uniref:Transposase MuDR plant domain-containing protein n=1 Tax=Cuscuta campestris TaxID=132261 RepID=A0A484N5H6_9ASTE|nr:unnamed protein product [Cuscuta campestris]